MLIAAGSEAPLIVLVPVVGIVALLCLMAQAFSRSSGQRLASLLFGGLSTLAAIVVLLEQWICDHWYRTWFGSMLDHYWWLFLIVAMTGGATLGAAIGACGRRLFASRQQCLPTKPAGRDTAECGAGSREIIE